MTHRFTSLLTMMIVTYTAVAANSVNIINCTPDYCAKQTCPEVRAEDCSGEVLPKSSICGCCDACVAIIEEGGWCLETTPAPGYTNFQKCAEGTQCIRSVCAQVPTTPQS